MRALGVAVFFVLLSLCQQTEGQPCQICRPDAAVASCEAMTPPKDVKIDGSVCSTIENKYKDYHKKMCEKYPPPKGYIYQCTTPGTTNTFSCQSSCGPRLEDVGKGLNLDLLQGGGLLANFNNRPQQRGTGLFDFNTFNNDNSRGNTNFGQFATLNGLNNFNNFNNFNKNNHPNRFQNSRNNNFNAFNTQAGANGNGKFQTNVLTKKDPVPISGGIRGSGLRSENPPPTVNSPLNSSLQFDLPPETPSDQSPDQPPAIGTLLTENYPLAQGVNQPSSFSQTLPSNQLLKDNGMNIKENKIFPPVNEPSVANFIGESNPPVKSYSVEVDTPVNSQGGNNAEVNLLKGQPRNSQPGEDYLKNQVSDTFSKEGKNYLPGSKPKIGNNLKNELLTGDISSANNPAELQTLHNADSPANARSGAESPTEPHPGYPDTYPIDLSRDEVYPGGQPPKNSERYVDTSGAYPDQPPPPQQPPQAYPNVDQFLGADSSSQSEGNSPQDTRNVPANQPPPENYPVSDLIPTGFSPDESDEESDTNQDPKQDTTPAPYSPTPTDPQATGSSGGVTLTTGTPQGVNSEEDEEMGGVYPPVVIGQEVGGVHPPVVIGQGQNEQNQASAGKDSPPRIFDVPNDTSSGQDDNNPPTPVPTLSPTPSPRSDSEEGDDSTDDDTNSSSSNNHHNLPPEAFQNPFRNPSSPYGKRTDHFESNPAFVGTSLFSEGFLDSPERVHPAAVHRPRGLDAVDIGGYQIFPGFQQFEKTGATDTLGINSDEVNNDPQNIFSLFLQRSNQPARRGRGDGASPSRQPYGLPAQNPGGNSGQNLGRPNDGFQLRSSSRRGGQNANGLVFNSDFFQRDSRPNRPTNTGGAFPSQQTNPIPSHYLGTPTRNNQNQYRPVHSAPSVQVSGGSRSGSNSGRSSVHDSANDGYKTSSASSSSTPSGDKQRRGFTGFGSPDSTDQFGFPGSFGSFNNQGFNNDNFNNKHISDDLFNGPSATTITDSSEKQS